jgi:diguanylate cyclase (GGDEF)-like protein
MALMTAICTTLASAGVLASLINDRKRRLQLQLILGIAVFCVAGLMSAEGLTYRNPPIGQPHDSMSRISSSPGRMTPDTIVIFLLAGYALVLCGQKEERLRTGVYIRTLSLPIFFYGAAGLLEHTLKFESLQAWHAPSGFARMPLPMSVGTMLLAGGFWSISYRKENRAEALETNGQELAGILGVSTIVVFSVAAAAGFTVIALMQPSILCKTAEHLTRVAHDNRTLIEQAIHERSEVASLVASGANLPQQLRAWSTESAYRKSRELSFGEASSPSPLRESGTYLLQHGFSGISFRGTNGEQLTVGKIIEDSALRAPLRDVADGDLIWKHGYFLSTRATVRDQEGVAGEILAQQPLPVLDRLTSGGRDEGSVVTLVLCTPGGDAHSANCFPTQTEPAPFHIPLDDHSRSGTARLPMARALAGESGTGPMKDHRDASVEASYLPIRNALLGLVVEVDSAEAYEEIQGSIGRALPLIVLFSLAGLWVMQWRLRLLVDKLVASREQIRQLALHDVLTGLPNRSLMEDRLQMALLTARRSGSLVALAIVDVDNFKTVNDNFGHEIGDLVLKAVANGLRSSIRASDTAARLGGDEFVLIIPEIKFPEATILVAKKIQAIFSSPITAGSYTSAISLSIGVAVYPAAGEDSQSLLRNADAAMYRAKKQGGNRFEIYGPTLRGSSSQ